MTLGSSSDPDITMALMVAQATQISMAPVTAWPSGTNMSQVADQTLKICRALSGNRSHGYYPNPGYLPKSQIWPQAAALAQMSP